MLPTEEQMAKNEFKTQAMTLTTRVAELSKMGVVKYRQVTDETGLSMR